MKLYIEWLLIITLTTYSNLNRSCLLSFLVLLLILLFLFLVFNYNCLLIFILLYFILLLLLLLPEINVVCLLLLLNWCSYLFLSNVFYFFLWLLLLLLLLWPLGSVYLWFLVLFVGLFHLIVEFLLLDSCQWVFNILDCSLSRLVVLAASLSINFKTKDLRFIEIHLRGEDNGFWVMFQEYMRETCPEISSININAAEFWQVDFLTPWAKHLESRGLQRITKANWQGLLSIAESTWTIAISTWEILLVNLGNTSWSVDVSGVDQSV